MNLKNTATRTLLESIDMKLPASQELLTSLKESEGEKKSYSKAMSESYQASFGDQYKQFGAIGDRLLKEDIEVAQQVISNNMKHELFNETADIRLLTASSVTTMRKAMEANIFRAFDTQAAESPIITMEFQQDTLTNSKNETVEVHTAFDDSTFLETVETPIAIGKTGIAPFQQNTDLLTGFNKSLHRIDTNIRITGIEYHKAGGTAVDAEKIKPKKGSNPYFDSKTGLADIAYIVETDPSTFVTVNVTAKVDFGKGVLETLNTDAPYDNTTQAGVKKVFFDIHLAHDAHQNAITVSTKNRFTSVPIPTSVHFEVSESIETLQDIKTGESALKGKDVVSILSEKMVTISANKEDLILYNELEKDYNSIYEMKYDYEAPNSYAAGSNFEWVKLNFINLIDLLCTSMKKDYHVKNAEFRILLSPIMLRIVDNGYVLGTEEAGTSLLNYNIKAKTAANSMIFISSERYDEKFQINMILTDRENPIIKTFDYWKFQSFLTDALQSSKNATRKAITFSERNIPIITDPVACKATIDNLPHKTVTAKNRFFKVNK